jgi:hypothetical protein
MLGRANDLNTSMAPGRGNWLSQALAPRGVWAGFHVPYPAGQPTNFVHTSAGSSAHELDWLLLSPDTPCTACQRDLLPGLSTHKALQCDLTIPGSALRPVDPAGRQFRFQQATAEAMANAAALTGLLLWWATAAGLSPDSTVLLCWDGLRRSIPVPRRRWRADMTAVLSAADALQADGEPGISEESLSEWWARRNEEALISMLRLDRRRLLGANITSQTGAALRLTSARIQPMQGCRPATRPIS